MPRQPRTRHRPVDVVALHEGLEVGGARLLAALAVDALNELGGKAQDRRRLSSRASHIRNRNKNAGPETPHAQLTPRTSPASGRRAHARAHTRGPRRKTTARCDAISRRDFLGVASVRVRWRRCLVARSPPRKGGGRSQSARGLATHGRTDAGARCELAGRRHARAADAGGAARAARGGRVAGAWPASVPLLSARRVAGASCAMPAPIGARCGELRAWPAWPRASLCLSPLARWRRGVLAARELGAGAGRGGHGRRAPIGAVHGSPSRPARCVSARPSSLGVGVTLEPARVAGA